MPLPRRILLAGTGLLLNRPARAQPGQRITILLPSEPQSLVPGTTDDGPSLIAGSKIYQGLLRFSPTMQPLPELARSWIVSSDARTTIFKLQQGVTWHDGTPFTSADVIYSVVGPGAAQTPRVRAVLSRIKAASAPDPETVLFTLDAPFAPFLLMFDVTCCPMLPQHRPTGTVGTGPFTLAEWRRGEAVRLVRSPQYWRPGLPLLDELLLQVVPDAERRAAPEKRQIAVGLPNPTAGRLLGERWAVMAEGGAYYQPVLRLDLDHRRAFADGRVRRALSLAIDRDLINRQIWSGLGRPAVGPVASTAPFFDPALPPLPYDPRLAASLLNEAGLRPNAQGIRLTFTLAAPGADPPLLRYLQAALKQVGIQMRPADGAEPDAWLRMTAQFGDPTLGLEPEYLPDDPAAYQSDQLQELFSQARLAEEASTRRRLFAQIQQLLLDDMAQVWLIELPGAVVLDPDIWFGTPLGTGILSSFDDLSAAPKD